MKNLMVSTKLVVGVAVVLVATLAVGIVGIAGFAQMSKRAGDMYAANALPLSYLEEASDDFNTLQIIVREALIYSGDTWKLTPLERRLKDSFAQFEGAIDHFSATDSVDKARVATIIDTYNNVFKPGVINVFAGAQEGRATLELMDELHSVSYNSSIIANTHEDLAATLMHALDEADNSITDLYNRLRIVILAVILAAVILGIFMALYISRLISTPLKVYASFMARAGGTGDLTVTRQDEEVISQFSQHRDEIGRLVAAAAKLVARLEEVNELLGTLAAGDLTVELALLSEQDTIGLSMKKMVDNLNAMFSEIRSATAQVSIGSKQIADGAQNLAQGSTEQASAVEELSASIAEIAQKTRVNAEMAGRAAALAGDIKGNAEKGNMQMDQMMQAVQEINDASHSINKVIKVIDDIAFQTNILALNAAVEAARAGQHGKGFAVVAEEVRNLAAKSAEAAKETGALIANSIEKAEIGSRIAGDTAASLGEIVSGINESSKIVDDIARSSEEQSLGIEQINIGIDQVAQVVQQNSATAEQSAAASQQMSGQAESLELLISQFTLRSGPARAGSRHAPRHLTEAASYSPGDSYGKY